LCDPADGQLTEGRPALDAFKGVQASGIREDRRGRGHNGLFGQTDVGDPIATVVDADARHPCHTDADSAFAKIHRHRLDNRPSPGTGMQADHGESRAAIPEDAVEQFGTIHVLSAGFFLLGSSCGHG
jgi:hypothetical protein